MCCSVFLVVVIKYYTLSYVLLSSGPKRHARVYFILWFMVINVYSVEL